MICISRKKFPPNKNRGLFENEKGKQICFMFFQSILDFVILLDLSDLSVFYNSILVQ